MECRELRMGSLGQLGWLEGIPFAKALRLEVVDKGAPGRPLRSEDSRVCFECLGGFV